MPPASRNQRAPTGGDTPAPTAASSLDRPAAIEDQKRRRSSRRAIPGRPGEHNLSRKARSERRLPAIATSCTPVLRRPLESALAALVAVMDDVARAALTDRHLKASSTSSVRRWLAMDQPTILRLQASRTTARYRNPPAVGTKVMSATQSWFGSCREVAIDQIRRRSRLLVPPGRGHAGRRRLHRPTSHTHQPRDPLAAMPLPFGPQLGMHARRSIGLARGGMDGPDPLQQRSVRPYTGRRRTLSPGVVAGLRHAEHARHDATGKPA